MKFSKLSSLRHLKSLDSSRLSLRNRLWLFQVVVLITILVCIFVIISTTGILAELQADPFHTVNTGLAAYEKQISEESLKILNNTADLANRLNKSIEKQLAAKGLTFSELKKHPELLNEILTAEVEKAVFIMEKAGASGVFVFLDATINPSLERARDSKAGFFLVNMNPHKLPSEHTSLFLLYGPASLVRESNMYLHTEWELELNVGLQAEKSRADLFNVPFLAAIKNKGEEIINLGYWNPLYLPADNTDKIVSFSVPLVDKNGNPYGVCGLEMSRSFFEKLIQHNSPPAYERSIVLFSTRSNNGISMNNALILGSNFSWLPCSGFEFLRSDNIPEGREKLKSYYFDAPTKNAVVGFDLQARIYPRKSVFKDQVWSIAMLIPQSDVNAKTSRLYFAFGLLVMLFSASIVATYFTSRYCIKPLLEAINKIKDNETQVKTNISEIDDLIEFLKQRPEGQPQEIQAVFEEVPESPNSVEAFTIELSKEQLAEFAQRLATLSRAERDVFDLYTKGFNAKEICETLCISINTVKTHNKRIYAKMNVSSRNELLSYFYRLKGEQYGGKTN